MAILTAETTFTIQFAEALEEGTDLILLPENDGADALRELHYPADLLPPLIYEDYPDRWENFDTTPISGRPLTKAEMTLGGNKFAQWPGYTPDKPVREIWRGSESTARMTPYFLRRLLEYFLNSQNLAVGEYITWYPKDRTTQGYNIVIQDLTVGGANISLDYYGLKGDMIMQEVVFTFYIVSEVGS
jgi:hypothetical protein